MSTQKSVVADALWAAGLIQNLAAVAEHAGVSFAELEVLGTEAGRLHLEALVRSIIAARPLKPAKIVLPPPQPTIRNKQRIIVDRVTPLEEQFAALAAEGKIRGDWWRKLNSKNYRSDKTRPTEILLGECSMGRTINRGENARDVVATVKGVLLNADPYEFVAWLRVVSRAGFEYWLAALDTLWRASSGDDYVPCVGPSGSEPLVSRYGLDDDWLDYWFFLVVCEE